METMAASWQATCGWSAALPAWLDSAATLVLAFGPAELLGANGPFDDVRRAFPRAVLAGASSGTVIGGGAVRDASLVVSVTRFDASHLRVLSAPAEDDAFLIGRTLAGALCETEDPIAVLALADGLLVNGPELVRGAFDALPAAVTLSGGLAADGADCGRTWVVAEGELRSGMVTLVGLYGPRLRVHSGWRGGSIAFGPRRRVTHAQDNIVYELDGQPALRLYEQFLGDCAEALPGSAAQFPFSVYRQHRDTTPVIRDVIGFNRAQQSITLGGDVPHGSIVQISRAGRGELLRAADQVAGEFIDRLPGDGPALNLLVSGIGRRVVLGEQTGEEIEPMADALPAGSSQIGFYSYGEIAGSAPARCDLHNMTLALTVICEAAA